ncbi:hypothetical protein SAMN05443575_3425 [Jatrophihabitans endophyticus]|uniref:Ribonuclease VapC n=1 Tax=Jatrophihabitans endophyticus TaxID=1206085 RepID=A0A1M5R2H0_9ACTN|nr:TA system VapC family ribonuclease toxin [Jatrophihabitans endophyticus]SHH20544.1 hypothetical protein SAMN05443575_3425 [Jatrophihabitans endophyticus]
MIAVDTNVLVYAHRRDSHFHARAAAALRGLAESGSPWAIPYPCLNEFYSVATHPAVFRPPSTIDEALTQVESWCASPTVRLLTEPANYRTVWSDLLRTGRIVGPRVHDARIAAICIAHGVREMLTHDRDFTRFPQLRTRSLLAD